MTPQKCLGDGLECSYGMKYVIACISQLFLYPSVVTEDSVLTQPSAKPVTRALIFQAMAAALTLNQGRHAANRW